MGIGNLLRKGTFFDLDYVYGDLPRSDGENPLDHAAMQAHPACRNFLIVATEADTGKVKYFTGDDLTFDNFEPIKASCAIPCINKPIEINGVRYFDGALADPVPVRKAVELGYDKIVLILTRPIDRLRSSDKDRLLARLLKKDYPMAAHRLNLRAERYNESVAYARQLEAEGRVLILAPDDITGVDTTKRSKEALMRLYGKGFHDAGRVEKFLK
jgi:predicted patatin/cPLA2 family phospholipase